ncbi:sensor histidine kinase [Kitasatospora sp. SUK 42]|uniref:sensor histidine kinase n=1 Tax=Kitasatospora sp. SUK 42 TaxID=1588882 RepID=UPI0018CA820B|nr:sensor histidine kinase [Kitasatospora sp. SUK 42]MBV2152669.1 sensor histidine kinase [Kitasatospora sp. SUK 42]
MTDTTGTGAESGARDTGWNRLGPPRRSVRAMAHSTALAAFVLPQLALLTAASVTASLLGLGVGVLLMLPTTLAVRRLAGLRRTLAGRWTDTGIRDPYLPMPEVEPGFRGAWLRCQALLADPATWRDLLWLLVDPMIGFTVALFPLAVLAYGVFGVLSPWLWEPIAGLGGNNWYLWVHVTDPGSARVAALLGLPIIPLGLAIAPGALRGHTALARALLGPTARAEALAAQRKVAHLTETRRDALTSQAAELRRIERDLHDGAQARLVAMGMNLGVAERLVERDPEAAKQLLAETRQASATALNELRDLVRGIHPPVLADRGLADAVRALGMDSPLDVTVSADLPGRPEAPVESAFYFAVSEALTNAAKHSRAAHVDVQLWYTDGLLKAQVTDDGTGGADPSRGTGLRGIERRLATFDGVLAVRSPQGGPTTLTMELPCELYSPRTSSS